MGEGETYRVEITPHAKRSLGRLRRQTESLARILGAIEALARDPRPTGCSKLKGSRYDNLYRIRVGDWRVIYAVEDERIVVVILDIVRREQAYR
jgi:mRNA interferase RelE/StbE